ncbi:uncharacterized protein BJ171DRAFT_175323 [Polychytrium aggregatum]|uniref:uncharacterized protein n=1 Tax=Polychytrium aggregatum TaxID=110093 RepID=UPI0022FE916B|nr:uncharacterized protein BJ171DRAFT_175323 [Polychytrium aggregatum]KAI9209101.1 hypothetical protein BJ171DRAFT_175323 [Polychytrium aggregatum]
MSRSPAPVSPDDSLWTEHAIASLWANRKRFREPDPSDPESSKRLKSQICDFIENEWLAAASSLPSPARQHRESLDSSPMPLDNAARQEFRNFLAEFGADIQQHVWSLRDRMPAERQCCPICTLSEIERRGAVIYCASCRFWLHTSVDSITLAQMCRQIEAARQDHSVGCSCKLTLKQPPALPVPGFVQTVLIECEECGYLEVL